MQNSAVLVSVILCLLTACATSGTDKNYKAARNNHGQPDLSGIWQVMNTAAYNIEPHTAISGLPAGLGVIIDTSDKMVPYTVSARARRDENFINRFSEDPLRHCYKPGVPRVNYLHFPFQIVQTENQVTLFYEYIHNTRTVFLDRTEHLDGVDFWNGDSVGRFEGDTLVVDVAGFNSETWLDQSGNFHRPSLTLEERYTPIGPEHMRYEVELTDPETYTRPWTMSMILYRHQEEGLRVLEYECHAYAEDDANTLN